MKQWHVHCDLTLEEHERIVTNDNTSTNDAKRIVMTE